MAGLGVERLAQGDLVARRHEVSQRLFRLGGEQAGHELAHARFGLSAHEPVDHLAVPKGVHGRDALHLEGLSGLAVGVDVHLGQHDLAAGLLDDLLEDRAQ